MKTKIIIFFLVFSLFIFSAPLYCYAQTPLGTNQTEDSGEFVEIDNTDNTAGTVSLKNPLTGVDDISDLVGKIINTLLSVVGSLALLMFVYGGLVWMTAAGNEDKIKKGKGILMWAAIGLVVIFASYTILAFVVGIFGAT